MKAAAARPGGSLCPSEVARALAPGDWRGQMAAVRDAAFRLAADGRIRITQNGAEVAPGAVRGPIRLSLGREGA